MAHTVKRIARATAARLSSYAGPSGELTMDTTNNDVVLQTGVAGGVRLAKDDILAGSTASVAGKKGLVPAPAAGDNNKYLKGDGTWDNIPASANDSTAQNVLAANDTYSLLIAATPNATSDIGSKPTYFSTALKVNPSSGIVTGGKPAATDNSNAFATTSWVQDTFDCGEID